MLRRLARAVVPGLRVPWARWSGNWAGVPAQVVDLRSDTVTRPGPAMRRAMAEALVGDDDYGEDPTVRGLQDLASPICSVDPATVETNMVLVQVAGLPPADLCQRLQAVSAEEVARTGCAVSVLLFPWTEHSVRTVWHRDVSAQDTELVLRKWEFVMSELMP